MTFAPSMRYPAHMPPTGESVYFPPVEKCLKRETQLLSWKLVYDTICEPDKSSSASAVEQFLSDESSVGVLSAFYEPFGPSTAQSRSTLETITAAINVTPSDKQDYDIAQIRGDALWLSQEARIDEVSALRITILQWQFGHYADLLCEFTGEEIVGLHNVTSQFIPETSLPSLKSYDLSGITCAHVPQSSVGIEPRRLRLLGLYVTERSHLLRVGSLLMLAALSSASASEVAHLDHANGASYGTIFPAWMERLGNIVLSAQEASRGTKAYSDILLVCIEALQIRITRLAVGTQWHNVREPTAELEDTWATAQLVEMRDILNVVLLLTSATDIPFSSAAILSWTRLNKANNFFEYPLLSAKALFQEGFFHLIRSLTGTISFAILSLPRSLARFSTFLDSADPLPIDLSRDPLVLLHPETVEELISSLTDALSRNLRNAGPSIFGWSILLQNMRVHLKPGDTALISDRRELCDTTDRIAGLSRRMGALLDRIEDEMCDGDPILALANEAVHGLRLYDTITSLATTLSRAYTYSYESVVDCRGRLVLLDLIRSGLGLIKYAPEVLCAVLAVLKDDQKYWDLFDADQANHDTPTSVFLNDGDVLIPFLLQQSQLRFPYELLPFLRLCNALNDTTILPENGLPQVADLLNNMKTFTQMMPSDFRDYEPVLEDENPNHVRLTQGLPLLSSGARRAQSKGAELDRAALWSAESDNRNIPRGTHGYLISSSQSRVIVWERSYSILKYMSLILSTSISAIDEVDYATSKALDNAAASEIVNLYATLIVSLMKSSKSQCVRAEAAAQALQLLEEASDSLDQDLDLVGIVSQLFEQEIHSQRKQPRGDLSLGLLVSCLRFIHALTMISPRRAWLMLSQSQLLDVDGNSGALAAIATSTGCTLGLHDFLYGCIRLLDALVEDAVTNAVARKVASRVTNRFGPGFSRAAGVPDKAMTKTLLAYVKLLLDAFRGSTHWKTFSQREIHELSFRLHSVLNKILRYTYGFDERPIPSQKITSTLAAAAEYIVGRYLSSTVEDNSAKSIVASCLAVNDPSLLASIPADRIAWISSTRAAITFLTTLLRVGRLLRLPASVLELELFKASPMLVRLLAMQGVYQNPVISLLEMLVRSVSRSHEQPPSLVARLHDDRANGLMGMLCSLGGPLNDEALETQIWRLLTALVCCQQHWFAVFLLAGHTPREAMKSHDPSVDLESRTRPFLTFTVKYASEVQTLSKRRALALFAFVVQVQNHWPWMTNRLTQHPLFLRSITNYLNQVKVQRETSGTQDNPGSELLLASLMAKTLAMCLHDVALGSDDAILKSLPADLSVIRIHDLGSLAYNTSLHVNLQKNLETKFVKSILQSLKRTDLTRYELGEDEPYDIQFAAKLLGYDAGWNSNKQEGFRDELIRANKNLCVVGAQLALIESWRILLKELGNLAMHRQQVDQTLLSQIVSGCLEAIGIGDLPCQISSRVIRDRLDLAFVLMQNMVTRGVSASTADLLVTLAWKTTRNCIENFDSAFEMDSTGQYQYLLKLLLLSLQARVSAGTCGDTGRRDQADANREQTALLDVAVGCSSELVEILVEVVAKGFVNLAGNLHQNTESWVAPDFALITAILRTILRIPGIWKMHSQIAHHFSDINIGRYATSLFSWSDQLHGNLIYGELSAIFLAELSKIPPMAEHLAVEGVLSRLSSASLMNRYRRPVRREPLDESARLQSIWTRGMLPLCLHLLESVQAPMVPEIVAFLNQFSSQLTSTVGSLRNQEVFKPNRSSTGYLSLSMTNNILLLALITLIIERFGAEVPLSQLGEPGALELAWDRAGLKEDLEGLLQAKQSLKERVAPADEHEAELANLKPSRGDGLISNRLEEHVINNLSLALACLKGDAGN